MISVASEKDLDLLGFDFERQSHLLLEKLLEGAEQSEVLAVLRPILDHFERHPDHVRIFRQPLGFVIFTLLRTDEYFLRLHLWPEDASPMEREDLSMHNHRSSVHSRILCGTLLNELRGIHDDPSGDMKVMAISANDSVASFTDTGRRVFVSLERKDAFQAGDSYVVDAGAYHVARGATDELTSTLCFFHLTDPSKGEQTYDIVPLDTEAHIEQVKETVGFDEVRDLTRRLILRLY